MDQGISKKVAAILSELGQPAPTNMIQTMLMKALHFVGWKFRYDGGCAVLLAGGNTIEFYDERGAVLKTVVLEAEKVAAA